MMEGAIELQEQKSLLQEIEEDFNKIWKKNKKAQNTFDVTETPASDSSNSAIIFLNHNYLNNMEAATNSPIVEEGKQHQGQVLKEVNEKQPHNSDKSFETYKPERQISQMKWKETQTLKEKIAEITEEKMILEDELSKTRCKKSIEKLQFKELQDSLKSEQYFSRLYKKQAAELKEELHVKERQYKELEEQLKQQGKIEREAQESDEDSEKDKRPLELMVKGKFRNDINSLDEAINISKDYVYNLKILNEQILMEKNDLAKQFKQIQDKLNNKTDESDELNMLRAQLKTEQILKEQAINKLHEIINRTDYYRQNVELKRNENNLKKLEQELTLEKEKFNQLISTLQKNLQDLTNQLNEEIIFKQNLQMELDSKDSEIEQLQLKLAPLNHETEALRPADNEGGDCNTIFEGWLSIRNKQNIMQDGWNKQFVVVSSKKVFFYNSESDKQNTDPVMILDLCKIFHVRSVAQGDVITADSNDVPFIFQILYAGEGEARKSYEHNNADVSKNNEDKAEIVMHKGHEFMFISYHMPTTCEVCPKPMWHIFRPPPALECRRCQVKIHKEHLESEEDYLAPCKLHYDPTNAKELLLLAPSIDEQKNWVNRLSRKIQKCGYKANNSNAKDSAKVSPRESTRSSIIKPYLNVQQRSATLPANSSMNSK